MSNRSYSILLCLHAGVATLYLNGMEVARFAGGVATLRELRTPRGTVRLELHHLPAPLPVTQGTVAALATNALAQLANLTDGEGNHSRLAIVRPDGECQRFVNGIPAAFGFPARSDDVAIRFGQAIVEAASASPADLSSEVATLRAENIWNEVPAHPRADWQNEVAGGDTNLGYWEWVEHRIEALSVE